MKQVFLLLTFLSLTIFGSGQTWAPIGAKWTFGVAWAFGPQVEYSEWISTGDTLVDGHICKVIQRYGNSVASDISDKLITYEDDNKIYWYNMNQFTVLYDFNKNPGETWTIMNDTCSLLITVDATGIDTINGFPLKALYISSPNSAFNGKILEHIGHVGLPNPDISIHCYNLAIDFNYYTGLRCYEDSVFGFHNFGIAPNCYFDNTGINESEDPFGLSLFPNPFSSNLEITLPQLHSYTHLTISDLLGREVASMYTRGKEKVIWYSGVQPKGIYIVNTFGDNDVQSFKVLKQ